MLYVMLVGAYPFERPEDKHDNQKLQKMIQVWVGAGWGGGWRLMPLTDYAVLAQGRRIPGGPQGREGGRDDVRPALRLCSGVAAAHPARRLPHTVSHQAVGGLPEPAQEHPRGR